MFEILTRLDAFFWGNIAFAIIIGLGVYLTLRMKFFQFRAFPTFLKLFSQLAGTSSKGEQGIHPLKVFFASVGGMIGIGNVVAVVSALQIGGPGALIWLWIAALFGSIIKYSEIYLGLKHRIANDRGGFDGGPLYFLRAAFHNLWIPGIVALLLCVYGVEIYQFAVVTDCLSTNWHINRFAITLLLLALVLFSTIGGIKRIGKICTVIMPACVFLYALMTLIVILQNTSLLPNILATAFQSAFTGHAALGGFAGSTFFLAMQQGTARAAYSADLGIGNDSIIQSESSSIFPERQASLAILGVFIDNLVCTLSLILVLISGLWTSSLPASQLVQSSLALYFPYMDLFMPLLFLILGYTTIISYFGVGMKCARYLSLRHGEKIYLFFGSCSFLFFSFFDQSKALLIMSLSGALLLILNLSGIFRLRHQVMPVEARSLIPAPENS